MRYDERRMRRLNMPIARARALPKRVGGLD
jgi:hypothetical protein